MKKFICKYIKPWFFDRQNERKLKPIRAAITIFIILIIISIVIKFLKPSYLSDTFVLGMYGGLGLLLGADTWRANSKDRNGKK